MLKTVIGLGFTCNDVEFERDKWEGHEGDVACASLLLQHLLLHITAGIKTGHRHAVSRTALHLPLSLYLYLSHIHKCKRMCGSILLSL